jgi:hypothetical protein
MACTLCALRPRLAAIGEGPKWRTKDECRQPLRTARAETRATMARVGGQREDAGSHGSGAEGLVDAESRGRAKTFDLLASNEKELFWIEGTTRRFKDGYNYFGRHPERIIAFFDKHMK